MEFTGDETEATDLSDPFWWVGATIDGKYRVERVVGRGGFGVVYRAVHLTLLGEPVAVKCFTGAPTEEGPARDQFLKDLIDEGKLLQRLSKATAGISRAIAAGAAVSPSGVWSPYLVLEWLEGRTLADDLDERRARGQNRRSLAEAMDLLEPAVLAVDLAHRDGDGIAHRDIKPENLFLAEVGESVTLKVLDFGIAKVMGNVAGYSSGTAASSQRAFSPAYGAPEQFDHGLNGLGATGPWTDVYALALVLLEMVTGRQPYSDDRDERRKEALDLDTRPSFVRFGGRVSDEVERVISKAVAVDPRNRFRTAAEFWKELRRVTYSAPRAHQDTPRRPAETEAAAAPMPAPAPIPATAARPDSSGGRHPMMLRQWDHSREAVRALPPRHGPTFPLWAYLAFAFIASVLVVGPAMFLLERIKGAAANHHPATEGVAADPAPATNVLAAEPLPAGTVQASHILIKFRGALESTQTRSRDEARARAALVLARLRRNEDFGKLAAEYGEDKSSSSGGDLGIFGRDRFPRAFTDAVFALEPGQLSGVIETNYGFHVAKRTR